MRYEWDMITCALFVAGAVVGSAAGYGLARRATPGPGAPGQAPSPRLAVAPTHPAAPRPALYDWDKDGAA
jgi:hypothetical protein